MAQRIEAGGENCMIKTGWGAAPEADLNLFSNTRNRLNFSRTVGHIARSIYGLPSFCRNNAFISRTDKLGSECVGLLRPSGRIGKVPINENPFFSSGEHSHTIDQGNLVALTLR